MHHYLNIAIKAARRAGTLVIRAVEHLEHLEHLEQITMQSTDQHNDVITSVNQTSQTAIIAIINKAYPTHGILAAGNSTIGSDPITWIIDPLNGTLNFIHGFPQYSIAIAIKCKGTIEHSVVFDPINNELFTASRGSGAQMNERRIRVSNCKHIKYALLATGFSSKSSKQHKQHLLHNFNNLLTQCANIRITGSTALDLAYIALGRLDGYWHNNLQPWQLAAGSLLVREAGGFISDHQGENKFLQNGQIIAGTTKVYAHIIEQLYKIP